MTPGKFIENHALWSGDQQRQAREVLERARKAGLNLIRLAWSDSHGHTRAKAVTLPVFESVLENGYNINVATWTLDAAGGRVFSSFTPGGGMDLPEMTGSPNLIIVPDPSTFRILPWAPGVGWVLCDEYFGDGTPFHFSARRQLRRVLHGLSERGLRAVVGLEVEWTLHKLLQDTLDEENVGTGGRRGRPIATAPLECGFSYHSESNLDLMQPVLSELARQFDELELGLRSVENEWGASQIECTFEAKDALTAADDFILFRTATRQICRRMGHLASFMTVPAGMGAFPGGWHLHMSIADGQTGVNLLMPEVSSDHLSPMGMAFLAGLLEHAADGAVFGTPSLNGYRRFRANSLAPDRATWNFDHRGTMIRLLGGVGDPATRFENRIGEPGANPYLFIGAQIIAGLDGVDRNAIPWPADDLPYEADRPKLPTGLAEALAALDGSQLYREAFGDRYVDYYLKLKQAELDRFNAFLSDKGLSKAALSETSGNPADDVTEWEMNEYFDFF